VPGVCRVNSLFEPVALGQSWRSQCPRLATRLADGRLREPAFGKRDRADSATRNR
jgi:hypothetical protein